LILVTFYETYDSKRVTNRLRKDHSRQVELKNDVAYVESMNRVIQPLHLSKLSKHGKQESFEA